MKDEEFQVPRQEAGNSEPAAGHPTTADEERKVSATRRHSAGVLHLLRGWTKEHTNDILWAAVFALIFAVLVSWFYDPPKPNPFTIYVVAHPQTEPETMAAFTNLENLSQTDGLNVGKVPVHVKLEKVENVSPDAAVQKASELTKRGDTLLVIANLPSQPVEESLAVYFHANPPVPVLTTTASDEDLLSGCHSNGGDCSGTGGFEPLLQLSPTNKEQGRAAIRFATQHGLRQFMIVSDNDRSNGTYIRDLTQAYYDAIDEFNREQPNQKAAIVGKYDLDQLMGNAGPKGVTADCILYAGELASARGLVGKFPGPKPMVILSDTALDTRLSDTALQGFDPVRFTFQTDASDYNHHTNTYGQDAYYIAKQLIGDLNRRGGDLRYQVKWLLHIGSVSDARRNLVRIMQENSVSRTWYQGASGELDSIYVFSNHKRRGAIFHVWQLTPGARPGSQMDDIDNWHPPKRVTDVTQTVSLSAAN